MKKRFVNVEIDHLTNSIINRVTKDKFDTQVLEITNDDLIQLKSGWNFNRISEFQSESSVYKLIIENNFDVIQGLVSLSYRKDFVFLDLIESADFNIGRNKIYYGVAGNLFAFACKQSWDKGNFGYVAFDSKTNLIGHYTKTIGAKQIGNSNQMIIEPNEALKLINQYYNEEL